MFFQDSSIIMELTAGLPYFFIKKGLLFEYPRLTEDKKTTVLVIGGGISGALSAYYLTEAGFKCILVDSRSIGLGSTCASTSLLQYELDIPLHRLMILTGKATACRAYQLCHEAVSSLIALMNRTGYSDYQKNDSLLFTTRKSEKGFMEKEFQAREEAGFKVKYLDSHFIKNEYGIQAKFGILSEQAATVNIYELTHHLLQYAIKMGLEVYDRSAVTKITPSKNGVRMQMESGNCIESAYVINATGYEVVNFIGKSKVNFDCTYAIASDHYPDREHLWKRPTIFWNTDDPYLYMRSTPDNRIIVGGRDEPYSNKVTRQLFLSKKGSQLESDVKRIMPALKFRKEFIWSGTFGKTKDSLPFIGNYNSPRIFYALGFGGNGITFSDIAARMICEFLQGYKSPDAEIFSFTRKQKVKKN